MVDRQSMFLQVNTALMSYGSLLYYYGMHMYKHNYIFLRLVTNKLIFL